MGRAGLARLRALGLPARRERAGDRRDGAGVRRRRPHGGGPRPLRTTPVPGARQRGPGGGRPLRAARGPDGERDIGAPVRGRRPVRLPQDGELGGRAVDRSRARGRPRRSGHRQRYGVGQLRDRRHRRAGGGGGAHRADRRDLGARDRRGVVPDLRDRVALASIAGGAGPFARRAWVASSPCPSVHPERSRGVRDDPDVHVREHRGGDDDRDHPRLRSRGPRRRRRHLRTAVERVRVGDHRRCRAGRSDGVATAARQVDRDVAGAVRAGVPAARHPAAARAGRMRARRGGRARIAAHDLGADAADAADPRRDAGAGVRAPANADAIDAADRRRPGRRLDPHRRAPMDDRRGRRRDRCPGCDRPDAPVARHERAHVCGLTTSQSRIVPTALRVSGLHRRLRGLLGERRLLDAVQVGDAMPGLLADLWIDLARLVEFLPQAIEHLLGITALVLGKGKQLFDLPADRGVPVSCLCMSFRAFGEAQERLDGGQDRGQDADGSDREPGPPGQADR